MWCAVYKYQNIKIQQIHSNCCSCHSIPPPPPTSSTLTKKEESYQIPRDQLKHKKKRAAMEIWSIAQATTKYGGLTPSSLSPRIFLESEGKKNLHDIPGINLKHRKTNQEAFCQGSEGGCRVGLHIHPYILCNTYIPHRKPTLLKFKHFFWADFFNEDNKRDDIDVCLVTFNFSNNVLVCVCM